MEMGEARRKAAIPAMISVLIPERGRPEMLERCIRSLLETAGDDKQVEILVAIDDDDPAWTNLEKFSVLGVKYFVWPRPITLGEKLNQLAREAKGSILAFLANDYTMETPGWPAKFRAATAALPNGIGIAFPHDDLHPGHAAFPIITRKMMDAVGFAFPPFFGIGWFIDTWQDEIGLLLGQHHEINVTVRSQTEEHSKTHGMVDLPFWVEFFNATRALRIRDATNLAAVAYGEGSAAHRDVLAAIPERANLCVQRARHLSNPDFLAYWGARSESPPGPQYSEVKAYAENLMREIAKAAPRRPKVALCIPSQRTWEGATATAVAALAAYSAMSGIEIAVLNVQCSAISQGRNSTVTLALEQNMDWLMWIDADMTFTPDALVRILDHGKDICGATYNRRTPNAQGVYTTLGKLVGDKPATMNDGLYEAALLPGGMMLVKAEVYRRIGMPYYAEAHAFPGADGLAGIKGLFRAYFSEEPPAEVLDSLDDTAFGAWIRDRYIVGDEGDRATYFSEDNWFCRRARRAGYKIWCDIKLTGAMGHIGSITVTTDLPSDIEQSPPPVRHAIGGEARVVGEAMRLAAD
jgi:glycosyltransferase involved in cell wall biosynthesis